MGSMPDLRTSTKPVPCASVAQVLAHPEARVIDLRSPGEFADDHLPGAVNVPLFDDAERALVGTLYARSSAQAAFDAATEIVEARVRALVDAVGAEVDWTPPPGELLPQVRARTAEGIAAMERELVVVGRDELPERPVVLHCWRGGLRSRSVVSLLRELGLERAVGLEGGYKAYRKAVLAELESWSGPTSYVLRGLTGVGKTLVLRELEALRPGWTVDLEGLAGHRSSILGMVGLAPVTQKRFDSALAERLRGGLPGLVVYEGESRKVGDAIIPSSVWESMRAGVSLELTASTSRRVAVLTEDYLARQENRGELRAQLPFIEARLGSARYAGALVGMLDSGREDELVELLLDLYYDPLYRHSEQSYAYAWSVDTGDPVRAAGEIATWIEERGATN